MKIISPSFEILTPIDADYILHHIERCTRTAYKSEDKIGPGSAERLIASTLKRGHESVVEHISLSVRIICDRGVTHEIVRHRMASYTQESTRYCNYGSGKFGEEITVIKPPFWPECDVRYAAWANACAKAEDAYIDLLRSGATPQEARAVLPNSLKTEIVMTANIREWRHFFRLRCDPAAHPQIREIARPLLAEMQSRIPILFDDIYSEVFGNGITVDESEEQKNA